MRRMDAEPAAPRASEFRAFYVLSLRASTNLPRPPMQARARAAALDPLGGQRGGEAASAGAVT